LTEFPAKTAAFLAHPKSAFARLAFALRTTIKMTPNILHGAGFFLKEHLD
jgi:hypothetical protein